MRRPEPDPAVDRRFLHQPVGHDLFGENGASAEELWVCHCSGMILC